MPKVSVVMAVYNGEKYLKKALESILGQTFSDFEFLIVDDASTDQTISILKSYQDPRIKILNNSQNIGLAASLNKALYVCKGEYIARQDADDISLLKRLEQQVAFMEENREVGLLGTSWYSINEQGERLGVNYSSDADLSVHFIAHGTVLLRRSCLIKVGYYREIFRYAQDYDLWLRLGEKFKIRNLRTPLYCLRIHEDSVSQKKEREQALYSCLALKMAEERKVKGKDSLDDLGKAVAARDKIIKLDGKPEKKLLSQQYFIWSQAAFALGENRKAIKWSLRAWKKNFLSYQAIYMLFNVLKRKIKKIILKMFLILRIPGARNYYWNLRAADINDRWGKSQSDYPLLKDIILKARPERLLDVGCGTGRLFPLYEALKVSDIVLGQEISSEAIKLARESYPSLNIEIINKDITALDFPPGYFDLIISNRVLQHIVKAEIESVIRKLTQIGKRIYVNEMQQSDEVLERFYLFKHNYQELFAKFGFSIEKRGFLGSQTWFVFTEEKIETR